MIPVIPEGAQRLSGSQQLKHRDHGAPGRGGDSGRPSQVLLVKYLAGNQGITAPFAVQQKVGGLGPSKMKAII